MKLDIKKPIHFVLALLPISIAGSLLVASYGFSTFSEDIQNQILEEIGSYNLFLLAAALQGVIITSICAYFGYILAQKTGLLKPFIFEKSKLIKALVITFVGGLVFSLDYWTFGNYYTEIQEVTKGSLDVISFLASILYGGIIEEILLRFFFMSLIAFILWKLFFKKLSKEEIPNGIFITANIVAATLFAAGHLPATVNIFGELTPLLVFRCFLLNGSFGLIFGWLYHKYGIQYAMLGHMGFHIVSKTIWIIFI
ncbi:MAG: CPBP family intramembrane metalloprotease [Crocinitomicaceae bacterium]|nr:CPBP family intramembrane metalloprotease [Crocinitomicaceae bacterium]